MPHNTKNVHQTDVLVIGWGLAGLVAAREAVLAGRHVTLIDQETRANVGGQAFWSFGGLFFIDSPEQRAMGIRDSLELARQDWFGTAGFDREEDAWPRKWAEAYLQFAAGEKREWVGSLGIEPVTNVGWAERGGYSALGPGNSVPRFHITWGTGPGVIAPFVGFIDQAERDGRLTLLPRHKVTALLRDGTAVTGAAGNVLADDTAERGFATNREVVGDFSIQAGATVVSSGGIGGNHDMVRAQWPTRLGAPPTTMIKGVPAYVDGSMYSVAEAAGAHLINGDRMWHYVEGIQNHDPIWPLHGIRILPRPSSLWLDAAGKRLPVPLFPGFDTLGTLTHLRSTGADHSWFVSTRQIVEKEFGLSGSEQNPELVSKEAAALVAQEGRTGPRPALQAFIDRGADFVTADTLEELVQKMQVLPGGDALDGDRVIAEVRGRDRELDNDYTKDTQVAILRADIAARGDGPSRNALTHRFEDIEAGPLIAVKLHVLTRKSLGGIQTDLSGRAIGADGEVVPGLFAAGEASGFGGGGVHGYRALEGTFLGGCLFSGRQAGRGAAASL